MKHKWDLFQLWSCKKVLSFLNSHLQGVGWVQNKTLISPLRSIFAHHYDMAFLKIKVLLYMVTTSVSIISTLPENGTKAEMILLLQMAHSDVIGGAL